MAKLYRIARHLGDLTSTQAYLRRFGATGKPHQLAANRWAYKGTYEGAEIFLICTAREDGNYITEPSMEGCDCD